MNEEFRRIQEMNNSARLAEMAKYLNAPIKTYTVTGNKECAVSAVNVDTNRFTSVAHTLATNDVVYPVANIDAGLIYPIDKYPGGITYKSYPGYYVKKIDADTFELYSDSGLTTIVDLTTNVNMDLTKWHFETSSMNNVIDGFTAVDKVKVKIKGRNMRASGSSYVLPTEITAGNEWIGYAGTTYTNANLGLDGDISIDAEVIIDYKGLIALIATGIALKSSSSSANAGSQISKMVKSPKYRAGTISSITISGILFANGSVIEVYRA